MVAEPFRFAPVLVAGDACPLLAAEMLVEGLVVHEGGPLTPPRLPCAALLAACCAPYATTNPQWPRWAKTRQATKFVSSCWALHWPVLRVLFMPTL